MNRTSTLTSITLLAYIFGVCLIGINSSVAADEESALKPVTIDLAGWASEDAKYTNPIEGEVVEADGKKQLTLTFKGGETDKAVFCKSLDNVKIPEGGTLTFTAHNPGSRNFDVSIAVKTGENWTFHESKQIKVKNYKTKTVDVSIDLASTTFKSEATKWKNKGAIADAGQIKSLQLAVYNGKKDGVMIISDLAVTAKP